MPKIDFAAVRASCTLADVLDLLDYPTLSHRGHKRRGPCPKSCTSSMRHCSFRLDRNVWYCHRCRMGGNHLDLYAVVRGLRLYEAAEDLCGKIGRPVPLLGTR